MATLSPNLNVMIKAAEKASRSLLRDYGEVENLQLSKNGPDDFVIAAHKRAQDIIQTELIKSRPAFGFLTQLGGDKPGEDKDQRWIIDPLNGSINFLHGLPYWSISIALEKDEKIISSLVYSPINDELFHAEKGCGAFSRNKRLRVSGRNKLKNCIIATTCPAANANNHEIHIKRINKVNSLTSGTRIINSPALDLAYVAAGKIDAFWENENQLKPWDKAASSLIIKESGGFFDDLKSKHSIYGNNLLSGNLDIRNDITKLLKSA